MSSDLSLLQTTASFDQARPDINDPGYETAPDESGFFSVTPLMGCCLIARRVHRRAGAGWRKGRGKNRP